MARAFSRTALAALGSTSLLCFSPSIGHAVEISAGKVDHVLLISIDGLHAGDLARFAKEHPDSAMAALTKNGVTYTDAFAPFPSDSFPGLTALITGGQPKTTGIYYDVSYDRALSAAGSDCKVKGTEVAFDESIDFDPDSVDAGGGIDVKKLPLDAAKGCTPVYPHQFLRVNTIFEVAKEAGKTTAWSDKHPAYDLVNGPSGKGVDDLFNPEINGKGITDDIAKTEAYEDAKVAAVVHEIDGKDHTGAKAMTVPAIFGMNFQAVSVAEKNKGNGYKTADGVPSDGLAGALAHTDASLGAMLAELKAKGLADSTLVIVTAKHGQSPIDISKRRVVGEDVIPDIVNGVEKDLLAHIIADDVALIWLSDHSKTDDVIKALQAKATEAGIARIHGPGEVATMFGDATKDSRVPDLVIEPEQGVIYAKLKATKLAEHGGNTDDDRHVGLVVSLAGIAPASVSDRVDTASVAPTILAALGLDPAKLQAVTAEKTPLLPGITFGK